LYLAKQSAGARLMALADAPQPGYCAAHRSIFVTPEEEAMNYPSAIVVAAGLIAGALVFTGQGISQTSPNGRYVIVAGNTASSANGVLWRGDTTNGKVSSCSVTDGGNAPTCSAWTAAAQ